MRFLLFDHRDDRTDGKRKPFDGTGVFEHIEIFEDFASLLLKILDFSNLFYYLLLDLFNSTLINKQFQLRSNSWIIHQTSFLLSKCLIHRLEKKRKKRKEKKKKKRKKKKLSSRAERRWKEQYNTRHVARAWKESRYVSRIGCFPFPGLNRNVHCSSIGHFHLKRIALKTSWRVQRRFPLPWLMLLHISLVFNSWHTRVPANTKPSRTKSRTERNLRKGFPQANVTCLLDTRTSHDAFKFDRLAFVSRISSSQPWSPRICYTVLNLGI